MSFAAALRPPLGNPLQKPLAMRMNSLAKIMRSLWSQGEQGAWFDPSDFERYMAKGLELATPSSAVTANGYDNTTTASGQGFTATGVTTATRSVINLATIIGRTYLVEFRRGAATSPPTPFAFSAAGGTGTVLTSGLDATTVRYTFVATTTTCSVGWVTSAPQTFTIDNISVRELSAITTASLYQDAAGTAPVTAMEQPVGLMLDKRLGLVRGPELVTNGTFDTNTTGWTANLGTISVVNGALRLVGAGDYPSGRQSFAVTPGATYEVTGLVRSVSGAQAVMLVRPQGFDVSTGQLTTGATTQTTFQQFRGVIVATTATLYVRATINEAASTGTVEFDNISVREIPGNHASQATTTARPLLSARKNLLTYTATGLSAGSTNWGGSNNTGTLQADGSSLITRTSTTTGCFSQYLGGGISIPVGAQATGRIKVKKGSVGNLYGLRLQGTYPDRADCVINLDTGAITALAGNAFTGVSGTVSGPDVEGFYTVTVTTTVAGSALTGFIHGPAAFFTGGWEAAGTQLSNAYAKEPQLEYGPVATRYQRVNTATDYDWVGFPMYLKYDGVDDGFNIPGLDTLMDGTEPWYVGAALLRPTLTANQWPRLIHRRIVASPRQDAQVTLNPNGSIGVERWLTGTSMSSAAVSNPVGALAVFGGGYTGARAETKNHTTGTIANGIPDSSDIGTTVAITTSMGGASFDVRLYGVLLLNGRYPSPNEITGLVRTLANKSGAPLA